MSGLYSKGQLNALHHPYTIFRRLCIIFSWLRQTF
jgi:hypothetical protein